MLKSPAKQQEWKSKYRQLLEELETKEQRWHTLQQLLQTTVVRLTIAATGQDPSLDQILGRIKTRVKGDPSPKQLEKDLNDLSRKLTVLDLSEPSTVDPNDFGEPEPQVSSPLKALILKLALARETQDKLMAFWEQDKDFDTNVVLDELTQEINRLLGQPKSENQQHSQKGLLALLELLVQQFDSMPELQEGMRHSLITLQDKPDEQDWSQTLTGIADQIGQAIHAVRSQKSELEEFLSGVSSQLEQFEDWADWSQSQAQDGFDQSVVLEQSVSQQVLDMHDEMQKANNLDELKSHLQTKLDRVAQRLQKFKTQQQQRLEQYQQRRDVMQQEISGLKDRTRTLIKLWGHQRNQVMYDSLTQVYSRYAYDQRMLEEYQRWQRHGHALTFCLWDIDFFKRVNDTYGHRAGDRLLQLVAGILKDNTREEDFLARIGGEEFVMLLPSTERDTASILANKLREKVAATHFHYKGTPETVTISCGITQFRDQDTPLTVYNRADQALYQAKENGRNRCAVQ